MSGPREEFLSEEDLDLRNLTDAEFDAWWDVWFRLAQETNDLDEATYSHGVFDRDPSVPVRAADPREEPATVRSSAARPTT